MTKRMSDKDIAERRAKYGSSPCDHEGSMFWYLSPHDERGWMCCDCFWQPGEEPGYSPEHDRDLIEVKCDNILLDLADEGLLSVSNGSHGESLAHHAAKIARDARTFDQESIVAILARLCAGDGSFWRDQHEAILAGKDTRRRCHCGKLARIFCGGESYCSIEHEPEWR